MKGFTLIEVLTALAALLVIGALTVPLALRFYQRQTVDEAAANLAANLRQLRSQAVAGKADSAYGLRLQSGGYVMFRGASYAARVAADDIVVRLEPGLTISGSNEIVFAKSSGLSAAASYTVAGSGLSAVINVNTQGVVERP